MVKAANWIKFESELKQQQQQNLQAKLLTRYNWIAAKRLQFVKFCIKSVNIESVHLNSFWWILISQYNINNSFAQSLIVAIGAAAATADIVVVVVLVFDRLYKHVIS